MASWLYHVWYHPLMFCSELRLERSKNMMRTCPKCKETKNALKDFGIAKIKNEWVTLATYCKPCVAEKTRLHNKKRRQECLELLCGDDVKCQRCGYDTDTRALVFDHINDDGYLERRKKSGKNYLFAEIRKNPHRFQVLCANCNTIKAAEAYSPRV